MTLSPGTQVGRYEVVAELGSGGMGVVYEARDPRLKRTVAIKLLPPDLTKDDTAKQRFLQEAQAASALDHPNICTIHEINETDDGQLYLVMARYEGETLKERIERGLLKLDDAVDIATQVGQGLAEAHQAGIVHRDIKPANLLVTKQLQARLGGTPSPPRPTTQRTTNVEAYEALAEGRHYWSLFTPSAAQKALDCFERALSIDPEYVDAVVSIALHHGVAAWMFAEPRDALNTIARLAARALELDPGHGEAHGVLAFNVLWKEWDWDAADRLFRRGITLAPSSENTVALYGALYYLGQGKFEEATAQVDQSLELDPLAGRIRAIQARVLTYEGRFEEAEVSSRRALELDPGHPLTLVELGYALAFQHKFDEALVIVQEAIDTFGPVKTFVPILGVLHALAGRRDKALQVLQSLEEISRTTYVTPLTALVVYAALTELDTAFEWAHRSIDEHEPMMFYLKVHPMFSPLRDDARYPALLRRVNLDERNR